MTMQGRMPVDSEPAFTVKQLVCLWLDTDDLRAVRLASTSWCRAASSTVLAVAVKGVPGGSRVGDGAQALQQALAAYPCATRLRLRVHPKLLTSKLHSRDNGGSLMPHMQRKLCPHGDIQAGSDISIDSSNSSSGSGSASHIKYPCSDDHPRSQLTSKHVLCIDVPNRWKLLDRKGAWFQSLVTVLCDLLVAPHCHQPTGQTGGSDGSGSNCNAPHHSIGSSSNSNSSDMCSSSAQESLVARQVDAHKGKGHSSSSSSNSSSSSSSSHHGGRDPAVSKTCSTGCLDASEVYAGKSRQLNISEERNSRNAAAAWQPACLPAVEGQAWWRQQQQQRLVLKLPLLPPHSKTPWKMLSQLTNLGSLLLSTACPLSGKQVAGLAACAPHLSCLHAAVTGTTLQLNTLSKLTALELLHLHAVNVSHRVMSSTIFNMHQLRRLQITGDLQLQPLQQLPQACPHLTTLLLQQPLHFPQHLQQRARYHQQQQQQQLELLAHLPRLQHLSLISLEPHRVAQPAHKSCAGLLLRLQQRLQAGVGPSSASAAGETVLPLMEGVGCQRSKAGQTLADAFRTPRCYTPETLVEEEVRCASLRPRIMSSRASAFGCSAGQLLLQQAPEVLRGCRLWQLTVRSGSHCNLQEELQQCSPAKLHVVTLPALTDILDCVDWPIEVAAATPLPDKLRLSCPLTCTLGSMYIDTSPTQAGLVIDDAVLCTISTSCPHLCWLKLKGVLCFTHHGGSALNAMQKLQHLTLVDTRLQAVRHLSCLSQAAAVAIEPQAHMAERLACLAAAKKDVRAISWLLGCCLCAVKLHWGHPRYRALGGCYAGATSCALLLAAAPMAAADVVAHFAWELRQQVASELSNTAKALGSVPPIMRCWLPQQLQVLQLEGCCLARHERRRCCYDAAQQLLGLQHVSISLQHSSSCRTCVLITDDSSQASSLGSSSSRHKHRIAVSSKSSRLITVAEQHQPNISAASKLLRQAALPSKQLHHQLTKERLHTLRGQVKILLRGTAVGSALSLLLKWAGTRAAAWVGFTQ